MRTPESIRAEAVDHFDWRINHAKRVSGDVVEAEEDRDLGLHLLDAALALPVGEALAWPALCPQDLPQDVKLSKAMRVIPYVTGYGLRILSTHFEHQTAGEVPNDAVSQLIDGAETYDYNGVTLTPQNVRMVFRRLALD